MADDQVAGGPSEPAAAPTPLQKSTPPAAPAAEIAPGPSAPVETTPGAPVDPARLAEGPAQPTFRDRLDHWMKRGIAVLITAIVAVIVYFLLAAFLPRWWAGWIGSMVGGSFGRGIGTGLTIGLLCTLVPLLLIGFAFLSRGRLKNIPALTLCGLGVLVSIPNLLTLGVVLGTNNASHAGQRILDVDAPGFRAASLWGAIFGVLIALFVGWFVWGYRRRGKKVKEYQAHGG
ncbi:hypothetical protein [Millisia brevis]|uniref:hypothetical protein n=1 Tax=Millisia brevis TaxID=264148 RepID=UPI000AC80685|nr:hypothetical protein [Millisia brevis]